MLFLMDFYGDIGLYKSHYFIRLNFSLLNKMDIHLFVKVENKKKFSIVPMSLMDILSKGNIGNV